MSSILTGILIILLILLPYKNIEDKYSLQLFNRLDASSDLDLPFYGHISQSTNLLAHEDISVLVSLLDWFWTHVFRDGWEADEPSQILAG